MASDLAIVSGLTGRQTSVPAAKAVATGEQPSAWAPFMVGIVALDQPGVDELLEPAGELGELRAGGDRADDAVRELPAELLDRLERERLGALGVVRAHVDVHERPARPLARDLGAEPVDVVVVALDRDDLRPVGARGEDLLLLEVVRDEHVGGHPGGRGVRRHGVGEVARAAHTRACRTRAPWLEPSATETTRSLNECVGLAVSFLIQTSPSPSFAARRSAFTSGVQPVGSALRAGPCQREEVRVAPHRVRPGLDLALERLRVTGRAACS